ncbi:hypothetical protein NDU88_006902 [Pleurodeles waltl]|uniref:Uncharacterized protein n=1 Tax=Pleurodeles waltl TaxID=8319 RepID=A0AAV7RQA5_PLEWA|nr:hypothetical protein NDU88_006902 [Pleurodeles waltl]
MMPKVSFKHKVPGLKWKISAKARRRRDTWKNGVCVNFSRAHTDLRRYFSRGEVLRRFLARGQSLSVVRGITRCPRVCACILRLVFRLRDVLGGCAWNFLSHGRRCIDYPSGSRAALSLRGRASKFRLPRRRRVDQRRCAAIFSPRSKLCVEMFGARRVQMKKRSLFGPETSGNRRQALSKPLESTFTARQEFSKAAGQQQGSSPLEKADRMKTGSPQSVHTMETVAVADLELRLLRKVSLVDTLLQLQHFLEQAAVDLRSEESEVVAEDS